MLQLLRFSQESWVKKLLLLEKRNHIGGNCYDYYNEEGILVHKYGPHIFHTKYKEVWNYLSQFTGYLTFIKFWFF